MTRTRQAQESKQDIESGAAFDVLLFGEEGMRKV